MLNVWAILVAINNFKFGSQLSIKYSDKSVSAPMKWDTNPSRLILSPSPPSINLASWSKSSLVPRKEKICMGY